MEWAEVIMSLIQSLSRTSNYHNGSSDDAFLASLAKKVAADFMTNKQSQELQDKVSPYSIQSNYFGSR